MKVRRTVINEMIRVDEILPFNQIHLSVWCDALAPLTNIIPLAKIFLDEFCVISET